MTSRGMMTRSDFRQLYDAIREALLDGRSVKEIQEFVWKISNDMGRKGQ